MRDRYLPVSDHGLTATLTDGIYHVRQSDIAGVPDGFIVGSDCPGRIFPVLDGSQHGGDMEVI